MNTRPSLRLALIGLSGSGKTEVGRRVAETLGWPFADSDAMVVEEAGLPVPGIFAAEGEAGFREREARALERLSRRPKPLVASLGGGIVLRPENRKLLKNGFYVVWIQVDPKEAARRLGGAEDRPLLKAGHPEAVLRELEAVRRPLYTESADARVVSAAGSTPEATAAAVIQSLEEAPGPR